MRKYIPRRAGARWMEGAPAFIFDCFDEPKEAPDRYTVFVKPEGDGTRRGTWIPFLGVSEHDQSIWSEMESHAAAGYRYRKKHYRVRWLDLPEYVRKHVVTRYTKD